MWFTFTNRSIANVIYREAQQGLPSLASLRPPHEGAQVNLPEDEKSQGVAAGFPSWLQTQTSGHVSEITLEHPASAELPDSCSHENDPQRNQQMNHPAELSPNYWLTELWASKIVVLNWVWNDSLHAKDNEWTKSSVGSSVGGCWVHSKCSFSKHSPLSCRYRLPTALVPWP